MIAITGRDRALFRYLYENKVATRTQIARDVFRGVTRQAISRRLAKLEKNCLIEFRAVVMNKKSRHVYVVTQNGVDQIKGEYKHLITEHVRKSDAYHHDLDLVDIRHCIEKFPMAKSYLTENVLQTCKEFLESEEFYSFVKLRSDGVLEIETPKGCFLVALEYDSTDKSALRYKKKLTDYYFTSSVRAVLYICGTNAIMTLLKRIDKEICSEGFAPKIFYILKKDVQYEATDLAFRNINDAIFRLK